MVLLADMALGVVIAGFIVSFVLAFGIGANDVANSMGTSVGSKVLTLRQACILATFMEIGGAVLLGHNVSDTVRKGIVDPDVYRGSPNEYMLGNLSALGASAIWLLIATALKMPISGTHSIVGAVIGYSLVLHGVEGIVWWKLGAIVLSWFISPLMAGFVSVMIFLGVNRFILTKKDPIKPGLCSLPFFYGLTIFVNLISVFVNGPEYFRIRSKNLPKWTQPIFGILIAVTLGLIVGTFVRIWAVPRIRKNIAALLAEDNGREVEKNGDNDKAKRSESDSKIGTASVEFKQLHNTLRNPQASVDNVNSKQRNSNEATIKVQPLGITEDALQDEIKPSSDTELGEEDGSKQNKEKEDSEEADDPPGTRKIFSSLQIMTAAFGSFAHGGNDVSNAVAPLISLWLVYKEGIVDTKTSTPIWILAYGGVGISVGLWVWGRRVIKTMGEDLTKITPSSGFTIEVGAAVTVLIASEAGIPVSTTHCKVGSVVSVGWIRNSNVTWSLFRNIVLAWVVTVPVSLGLSAVLMLFLAEVTR